MSLFEIDNNFFDRFRMHSQEDIQISQKILTSNSINLTEVSGLRCMVCIPEILTLMATNKGVFFYKGGWPPNANSGGQYRAQYPPQGGPQQWGQGPRPGQPQGPNQWDQNRYPVNQQYGPVIKIQ